jgi:hypothetical protein
MNCCEDQRPAPDMRKTGNRHQRKRTIQILKGRMTPQLEKNEPRFASDDQGSMLKGKELDERVYTTADFIKSIHNRL